MALVSRQRIVSLALVAVLYLGMGGFVIYAVGQSQHQWCQALKILTARPVPYPKDARANPSRLATYRFYVSLVDLEHHFGC